MAISTPIDLLALIVAVIAAIKIVVLLAKPKAWLSLVKKVYAQPITTTIISLVFAIFVLYLLLEELTIIHVFAVMLFIALLAAVSASAFMKDIMPLAEKLTKDKKIVKKSWLAVVIWIILIIWALKELFV